MMRGDWQMLQSGTFETAVARLVLLRVDAWWTSRGVKQL